MDKAKLFDRIKEVIEQPKRPCNECCNSCGNSEAYMHDGVQMSCGWRDCYICKGTGELPTDENMIEEIKEIIAEGEE